MKKVLVTGATGFVGRHLIAALKSAGYSVRCAVNKKVNFLETEQIEVGNLNLETNWGPALDGIDIVIHLAARVHIMEEQKKEALTQYRLINSFGTKHLAEQAALCQVKRFIFLSSIKVNGEYTSSNNAFTELNVPNPHDPYAQSKLLAEEYLQTICQKTTMEIVILRPPLVYGPGVKANFFKMIQLVDRGFPLPFGSVHNKRSFIYIDNLISAILTVLLAPRAANQVYLLGDHEAISLSNLLRTIKLELKTRTILIPIPRAILNFLFRIAQLTDLKIRLLDSLEVDSNKIRYQLAWNPPVSFKEGMKRTVDWYRQEKVNQL